MHAKYHRVQIQEPARARPNSEQTQDQYAIGGMTWNLAPGPVAMPANLTERNAELWASPHGFLKAAQANHAKVEVNKDGTTSISFVMRGKYRFQGLVNREREVVWVRSFMDSAVLGDTPIEFRYLDYRDFDGVQFPHAHRAARRRSALVRAHRERLARQYRASLSTVPPEIAANPVPSVAHIEVTELAPGLLVFGGGSHNSVIVGRHAA